MSWLEQFPKEEQRKIEFAVDYARRWPDVGAAGHTWYLVMARMAEYITDIERQIGAGIATDMPEVRSLHSDYVSPRTEELATEKQVNYLLRLGRDRRMVPAQVTEDSVQRYGKALHELRRSEVSALIDEYRAELGLPPSEPPARLRPAPEPPPPDDDDIPF